jgi:L-alanine-DL-glutamate epimerase-like enolase superfamily enzyme
VRNRFEVVDGYVHVRDDPGLGVEIDFDASNATPIGA